MKKQDRIIGDKDGIQVAIVTDRGNLVTEDILKEYKIQEPASKQLGGKEEQKWREQVVDPPYDTNKLMQWHNVSVIHSSCVRVKVQDAVGIGFHLEPADETEEEIVTAAEEDQDYKELMAFFKKVNNKESLTSVLKKAFFDWESCGNAYLEISRDIKTNKINGIYHINATTIRWCPDKQRLIQRVGEKFVYFKIFGNEEILNKKTGNFVKTLGNPDDEANEVIAVSVYSWMSSLYGVPEWLPALYAMFGDQKETEYNLDFFSNYGIPAYAVIAKGTLTEPVIEEIKKYLDTEFRGSNHKTLILSTPTAGDIKFERLSVETKEASFRVYKKDNRQDILAAHRVPPYRVGIIEQGQLGGNAAPETDSIYLESVINPRQEEWMWVINQLIIAEGFQITKWVLEFDDINVANKKSDSEIHNSYIRNGTMTNNEVRALLGLDPYVGGDVFYVDSNLIPVGIDPNVEVDEEGLQPNRQEPNKQPVKTEEKRKKVYRKGKLVRHYKSITIIGHKEAREAEKEYLNG
jgi:PBSX family phage portal protein